MTREELITNLSEHFKNELKDVIIYTKLSKAAASIGLNGPAQILKDIAREEHLHAQHLENILKELNGLKEDNFSLKQNAREAIESV